jgi:hypothetical protein
MPLKSACSGASHWHCRRNEQSTMLAVCALALQPCVLCFPCRCPLSLGRSYSTPDPPPSTFASLAFVLVLLLIVCARTSPTLLGCRTLRLTISAGASSS